MKELNIKKWSLRRKQMSAGKCRHHHEMKWEEEKEIKMFSLKVEIKEKEEMATSL